MSSDTGTKRWSEMMDDMDNNMEQAKANSQLAEQQNERPDSRILNKDKCEKTQVCNRRQRGGRNRSTGGQWHQQAPKDEFHQRTEMDKDIEFLQNKVSRLSNLLEMETGRKKSVLADLRKERDWNRKLGDDLQKYKDALEFSVSVAEEASDDLKAQTAELSARLDTETKKNSSLSKEKESLSIELKKCKDTLEGSVSVQDGTSNELKAEVAELSARLETETKKNNYLFKEKESLTFELQKCKDTLLQKSEASSSSTETENLCQKLKCLEKDKFELGNKIKIEQEVNKSLKRDAENLFSRLQTEEKKNNDLQRWMKSVTTKLQKERRQRLELDVQLDKQAVAHKRKLDAVKQSSAETESLRKEVEAMKAINLELSTQLKLEEELSESLYTLNERLSTCLDMETKKLEEEQTWNLHLRESLQKEKDGHQQELEALIQELENMKGANSDILKELQAEQDASQKKSHYIFGLRKKSKDKPEDEAANSSSSQCDGNCAN
ncbi:hypothetical protein JOB18_038391 [Solea senegalensis]|uniref:Uncharacterized protein n=1 Tax=Solea senegalensis TaxID=28829 RepID=A0AAV6R0K1_SOLSE|nr:hypothetical protein JOB18_038391 [Solea senegalensis]